MIPKYPFSQLILGDFAVYAGRREDEADCEPLWQPLYDTNHYQTDGSLSRHPRNRKQNQQDSLPEAQSECRPGSLEGL